MVFERSIKDLNSVISNMKASGASQYRINEYRHAVKILKGDRIVTDGHFRGFKNVISDMQMLIMMEKDSKKPRKTVIAEYTKAIALLKTIKV